MHSPFPAVLSPAAILGSLGGMGGSRRWQSPVGPELSESFQVLVNRRGLVVEDAGKAEPRCRSAQHYGDIVEHQLSIDANVEFSTPLLQFPCIEPAGGRQSQIYAFMLSQILRRFRFWIRREVRWRPRDSHAQIRPDAHGDHVLGNR